jgi:hypothetical protein
MLKTLQLFTITSVLTLSPFIFYSAYAKDAEPGVEAEHVRSFESTATQVFIATVTDAREISDYSKVTLSNRQEVELSIQSTELGEQIRDAVFVFPNEQFKKPLKVGDQVLIETLSDLSSGADIVFISYYRQNALLVWTIILISFFLIVSGFKNNIRYIQVFLIFIVSGLIVLLFYKENTFLTFGLLFFWQLLATYFFAYRIFTKRIPSFILTFSVFINQLISMILAFVMSNIYIFDFGVFDVFFSTINDAREVLVYIFAVMITYPITVIFAEQVISESIRKKREESDITKIDLMKYLSKSNLKLLNYIFLTFFGLFFSVFISVVAIASSDDLLFIAANSSFLSQVISIGFLMLFNLVIFIPLISAITGLVLGRLETHELVTDRNLRQLEL